MKIVVDENMPYAEQLFSKFGEVIAVPGRPLPKQILTDAQALMVRSVTPVDIELVANTQLKFIGTATAGMDHVDVKALNAANIAFSAAPGCNAIAVVEYVLSALLALAERDGFELTDRKIGIVGAGNVGARLQQRCEALGIPTLICDPPRADNEQNGTFHSLETLVEQADILSFHTPLNRGGPYNSWHLMDEALLSQLRPNSILINACRGEVVDNRALLDILHQRHDLSVVLDVWEPEPDLDPALLAKVDIATAHIAGYTLEGKVRGTTQLVEALGQWLDRPQQIILETLLPPADIQQIRVTGEYSQQLLKRLAHLVYDVRRDDALLRQSIGKAGGFDALRKHYQQRREWASLKVVCDNATTATLLYRLGFTTQCVV